MHHHAGTKGDPAGISYHTRSRNESPKDMLHHDPRSPGNYWASSVKVRNFEAVHYPENKGWHT